MNSGKPTKTATDYMVMALSPVLIIVLVHSVCFFLLEVFYRGEGTGGARWVLFWFVWAVVLIARIGIEQGDVNAMVYGLALAAVTWLYLSFVQLNPVFAALLLGIVWFTAHKLTANCTLIDDDEDASGQGLMQSLRRLPSLFKKTQPPVAKTASPAPPARAAAPKKKHRAQVPGIWLIYYSVAALPIFGFGQMLLPAGDLAARQQGFIYLFLYLAAALGLLVTTSFLGLRRYLRQRYVEMPGNIAFGWIQFGVIAAVIVLLLSLLLPRPGAGEAWGSLHYQLDHQLRRASEYAARFNPHGTGKGRADNQSQPDNSPQTQPGQSPGQNENSNGNNQGEQSGKAGDHGNSPGSAGGEQPGKPQPNLSPAASALYPWLKVLFWLVLTLGLLWLLYRYRAAILTLLRSAWAAIRNFIALLLGLFQSSVTASPASSKPGEVLPFRTFKSPFLTGSDHVWPPEKLIAYTYEALQSWAMEQEAMHGSPKTPREFCRELGEEMPEAAEALEHLAFLYGHVAYGASIPGNYNPEHLRQLWHLMANPRAKQASAQKSEEDLAEEQNARVT